MLLNPLDDEKTELLPPGVSLAGIESVLGSVGLVEQDNIDSDVDPSMHVQSIFKEHGASLRDAARQIGSLLVAADNDSVKLKAAETILKIHKVLEDKEERSSGPSINITIVGSENRNLINVLVPSQ